MILTDQPKRLERPTICFHSATTSQPHIQAKVESIFRTLSEKGWSPSRDEILVNLPVNALNNHTAVLLHSSDLPTLDEANRHNEAVELCRNNSIALIDINTPEKTDILRLG